MATIPGHISDEIVIVGNHRDGMSIQQDFDSYMYPSLSLASLILTLQHGF